MSNFASPTVAAPRRRWPLFLIFAVVIGLVIAWTGLWFYVAAQAKAEINTWRDRERQAGRLQSCASLSVGGYPFRVEMRCEDGRFELEGSPPIKLRIPSVLTAVQVYNPNHLIAELASPLDVSQPRGDTNYVVGWNSGRASARGLSARLERGSLVLDSMMVRDAAAPDSDFLFKAVHFELHGRQAPGSRADNPAIETVLNLKDAVAAKVHPVTARPFDVEATSVLRGAEGLQAGAWQDQLRAWQSRNGEIEITKARLQQDDVIAEGEGTLRLTPRGGLDGNLQVTVVGLEKILRMFDLERLMSEGQVGATLDALDKLIPGLGGLARQTAGPGIAATLGRRTVLDGKAATTLPVRFVDGAIFLGPFQVGTVPPLF
jgi:hypothetical protein